MNATPVTWKDSFKTNRRESGGLAVLGSGAQRCQPGHSWGFGMRDHYLIHLIASGKGLYETEKGSYLLDTGDVFLIHPGTLVHYQADFTQPWEYYWVGFQGNDARPLLELCGFENQPVLHLPAHSHKLKTDICSIHTSRGSDIASDVRMTGALYLFLSTLISLNAEANQQEIYKTPLKQALQYINGNFSGPINVEDISRHAGISRSQLYRLFIKEMGISPISYLLKKRINEACRLFDTHHLSVNKAAYSVGFQDPLYFSRIFKKFIGQSPSAYRRSTTDAAKLR